MVEGPVAVIGTGLMGGSLGLALRRAEPSLAVAGYDADEAMARGALERGAVTRVARTLAEAADGARLVALGVPVDQAPAVLEDLRAHLDPAAVVTDLGSAKAVVVAHGTRCFGERFVGGHPMAGSERHGIEAADAALFEGASWILTPTTRTSPNAYSVVTEVVAAVGAQAVALEPDVHDALVARLSHLPQLVASAIVDVAASAGDREALLGLAAAGFRDVTRIAASHPDMWVAIIRANEPAVLEALRSLRERLDVLEEDISDGRWPDLHRWLASARSARLELFAKPDYGTEPVALSMVVPDRPGVLAEVTTAAGELGANIEDLRIMHSTEGGAGRLELVVSGREPAELLVGELIRLGYAVHRSSVN
ncbi:MAG: prephenate dehydrogenase/arogenate dehydrogenase family protein [Actinomycetota bacterium]|nr:prephenate dehydrogenase/arogenate dehydrogenase family protein [Actinomycetota bacterium]